jgi:small subunit ribosomal protein S8
MVNKIKTNYPLGDFLIRIKNAAMARNKSVVVTPNKQIEAVAKAFEKAGYLDGVKKEKGLLTVALTFKNKRPLLMDLKLISKPGLRIYMDVAEIESKKGPAIYLISTPKGIISSREAIKSRTGGEVICEVM